MHNARIKLQYDTISDKNITSSMVIDPNKYDETYNSFLDKLKAAIQVRQDHRIIGAIG